MSRMSQERLKLFAALSVEHNTASNINFDDVIDDFATQEAYFFYDSTMASNTVGELQEYCMQHRIGMPLYRLTMESGPPHNKTFTITCQVGEHTTKGTSNSKKDAKKKSAILMTPLVMNFDPATQLRREVPIFLQNGPQEQMETDYCGSFQNSYSPVSQQRPNAGTENMDLVEEDDYKSNLGSGNKIGMLQELCQRMKWEMPVYTENGILNQEQSIKCTLRDMTTVGFNISKKDAKKMAAGKMLALLNISDERFTSRPAKSNPTYASEHPIPINEFVSNSDIKSPKTVEDSTSKTPPDLAKVIELFRSLKSPKAPTISSNPDVVEKMHLKFQSKEGVILNEIIEAFNYEEQDDIDYLLLLEKLSKEQHFTMQFDECESLDPMVSLYILNLWGTNFNLTCRGMADDKYSARVAAAKEALVYICVLVKK